jgi:hypothetical protein
VPLDVHPDRSGLERVGQQLDVRTTTQYGLDPGQQLTRAVRLGDVVVGAQLEPDHLVHLGVLGADDDHRHVAPGPQRAADLGTGQARQHQVEQDDVRTGPVVLVQRVGAGLRDGDLESLLAQYVRQRVAVALLVFDDQHSGHEAVSFVI